MTSNSGASAVAETGFRADASSQQVVSTEDFNPARGLADRIDALLHPQRGLCRGMIEPSDKSHDKDSDTWPVRVGELREVRSVLTATAKLLKLIKEQSA